MKIIKYFLLTITMFVLFTTNVHANELTSEQYHVLQAVVQQEGGYEYENALWVMSTIQNRVDDERFPDTYWEVITQDGQFESYLASHYEKHLGNIDEDVARAIEDVMENGSVHDYLFFYADWYAQQVGRLGVSHGGNTYFKEY